MQPAIRVENLSKRYLIGAREERSRTLGDFLRSFARNPGKKLRALLPGGAKEVLWALDNVSFEVEPEEVLGLIGPNGAGKSTLLKILACITEPTAGRAVLRGRVASLLEIGTGFHLELTGRENIYLNGAILGMRRQEIRARLDEIVAFSGLERFIDTPVKRYSSGMYMRLAFAVAAHLEPEILLVDEVLAVGDAEFRQKCLGKMGDVARSGRTVLFVSHNMAAVRDLCQRCLWIDHGKVVRHGPAPEVVRRYLEGFVVEDGAGAAERTFTAAEGKDFQVRRVRFVAGDGEVTDRHDCDHPVTLELHCHLRLPVIALAGTLEVVKPDEGPVLHSESYDTPPNALDRLPVGSSLIRIVIPARSLGPGEYQVFLHFTCQGLSEVHSPGFVGTFRLEDLRTRRGNQRSGHFSTILPWNVEAHPHD